eukprot:TRINITY_DN8137_c0_g1_i1.p1 TRINITY_DN8137_c0_g1~~TRINITY_DN8137_c0_g1_i1.p1  ORF type:complete len:464 (+),score=106.04 TRINITY_DN8137_c0_g1_i1:90-1394(+)
MSLLQSPNQRGLKQKYSATGNNDSDRGSSNGNSGVERLIQGLTNKTKRNNSSSSGRSNKGAIGSPRSTQGMRKKSSIAGISSSGIVKALDFHKAMKDAGIKFGSAESDQLMLNISVRKDGRIDVSNLVKSQLNSNNNSNKETGGRNKRTRGKEAQGNKATRNNSDAQQTSQTATKQHQGGSKNKSLQRGLTINTGKLHAEKSNDQKGESNAGLKGERAASTHAGVDPSSPMDSMLAMSQHLGSDRRTSTLSNNAIGKHSSAFSETVADEKQENNERNGASRSSTTKQGTEKITPVSPPPLKATDSAIFVQEDIPGAQEDSKGGRPASGPSLRSDSQESTQFMRVSSPVTLEDTQKARRNSNASTLSLNLFKVNRRTASISSARSVRSTMSNGSTGSSGERFSPSKAYSMEDRRPSSPRKNVAFTRSNSRSSITG